MRWGLPFVIFLVVLAAQSAHGLATAPGAMRLTMTGAMSNVTYAPLYETDDWSAAVQLPDGSWTSIPAGETANVTCAAHNCTVPANEWQIVHMQVQKADGAPAGGALVEVGACYWRERCPADFAFKHLDANGAMTVVVPPARPGEATIDLSVCVWFDFGSASFCQGQEFAVAGVARHDPRELNILPNDSWVDIDASPTADSLLYLRMETESDYEPTGGAEAGTQQAIMFLINNTLADGRSGLGAGWATSSSSHTFGAGLNEAGISTHVEADAPLVRKAAFAGPWTSTWDGTYNANAFSARIQFARAGLNGDPDVGIHLWVQDPSTLTFHQNGNGPFVAAGVNTTSGVSTSIVSRVDYEARMTQAEGPSVTLAVGANPAFVGYTADLTIRHGSASQHARLNPGAFIGLVRGGDCSGPWSLRFENATVEQGPPALFLASAQGLSWPASVLHGLGDPGDCSP